MAGPNEQKFQQAIANGSPGDIERRAQAWRDLATAYTDAAVTIDVAANRVEPAYAGSADAAAAQTAFSVFSKAVREQRSRVIEVAEGLEQAAETMRNARAESGFTGPPEPGSTDMTPREAEDHAEAVSVAEQQREREFKAAYDRLVTGYAVAGSRISSAAPPIDQARSGQGPATPGFGSTAPGAGPASGYSSAVGQRGSAAHVMGYSTQDNVSVDLSPVNGQQQVVSSSPQGQVVPGSTAAGLPSTGVSDVAAGSTVGQASSAQATDPGAGAVGQASPMQGGGAAAGAAGAAAGGAALAKRVSGGARAASSAAAKPVTLGKSARTGSSSVLGKSATARAGSASPASRAGGAAAKAGGAAASRAGGASAAPRTGGAAASRAGGASAAPRTGGAPASRAGGASAAAKAGGAPASRSGSGAAAKSGGAPAGRAGSGNAARAGGAAASSAKSQAGASGAGGRSSGATSAAKGAAGGSTSPQAARGGGGSVAGKGSGGRRKREKAADVDHLRFVDEAAWLDDDETNPGVVR